MEARFPKTDITTFLKLFLWNLDFRKTCLYKIKRKLHYLGDWSEPSGKIQGGTQG